MKICGEAEPQTSRYLMAVEAPSIFSEGWRWILDVSHFDYNYSHPCMYHLLGCYLSYRCLPDAMRRKLFLPLRSTDHQLLQSVLYSNTSKNPKRARSAQHLQTKLSPEKRYAKTEAGDKGNRHAGHAEPTVNAK
jgi:hypothetical protein